MSMPDLRPDQPTGLMKVYDSCQWCDRPVGYVYYVAGMRDVPGHAYSACDTCAKAIEAALELATGDRVVGNMGIKTWNGIAQESILQRVMVHGETLVVMLRNLSAAIDGTIMPNEIVAGSPLIKALMDERDSLNAALEDMINVQIY